MAYHKVHCPRCGKIMNANELAFDFGKIINIALEKAKNRLFGSSEEWYFLTKFNLCLYLTAEELTSQYAIKSMPDHTYQGFFEFKVKHLTAQLVKLADSLNPNFSIDILASNQNAIEYNALTWAMAKSQDVDRKELAMEIQELAQMLKKNTDETVITSFFVTVRMDQDDQGNWFANRLLIEFDDYEKKNFTSFVCKGEKGHPCGKILYGQAGKYKEIIIGMAGTARVGKTAYLAALLASILRKGNYTNRLGYEQNIIVNIAFVSEEYSAFERDLLEPYVESKKITKTINIFDEAGKGKEAVSLFSMTFTINGKKSYIFTFIDMPGEVYDDSKTDSIDAIAKSRSIIKDADMIWTCISVEQVREEAQPGTDQVNTDWHKAIMNLGKTMSAIGSAGKMPTAVLVTKSDITLDGDKIQLYYQGFNPFAREENPMKYLGEKDEKTPWVSQNGNLYFSNMEWFIKKTLGYMQTAPGLSESIRDIFGSFTPFAVAPYGRDIDNIMAMDAVTDSLPVPSMIEGPFLWTLGVLGLLDVYKEEMVTVEHLEGWGPFKRTVYEDVLKNMKVDNNNLEKLYYFR